MSDTIGIDISKDTLDIYRLSDSKHARFGNERAGRDALRHWIGVTPVRIVYEATGCYHRDLERALEAVGHALVKVNPGPCTTVRPGRRPRYQDRSRGRCHAGAHGVGARP